MAMGSATRATVCAEARNCVETLAIRLVEAARTGRKESGGVDSFLYEYGLSSEEGVLLLCLAEALLRIPDAATALDGQCRPMSLEFVLEARRVTDPRVSTFHQPVRNFGDSTAILNRFRVPGCTVPSLRRLPSPIYALVDRRPPLMRKRASPSVIEFLVCSRKMLCCSAALLGSTARGREFLTSSFAFPPSRLGRPAPERPVRDKEIELCRR